MPHYTILTASPAPISHLFCLYHYPTPRRIHPSGRVEPPGQRGVVPEDFSLDIVFFIGGFWGLLCVALGAVGCGRWLSPFQKSKIKKYLSFVGLPALAHNLHRHEPSITTIKQQLRSLSNSEGKLSFHLLADHPIRTGR